MEESRILIGLDFSVASKEVIEILIDDASDPNLFQEIARANTNRPDILQLLQTHPDTPEDVRSSLSTLLHLPAPVSSSTAAARPGRSREIRTKSILQKIQTLSVSERLQLAMTASTGGMLTPKEARILALLAVGRANKEIGRAMDIGEQTVNSGT